MPHRLNGKLRGAARGGDGVPNPENENNRLLKLSSKPSSVAEAVLITE